MAAADPRTRGFLARVRPTMVLSHSAAGDKQESQQRNEREPAPATFRRLPLGAPQESERILR